MNTIIYAFVILLSLQAYAGGSDVNSGGLHTYTADLSSFTVDDQRMMREICKLDLQIDTSGNVAEQVVAQIFGKDSEKSQIEKSKGSIGSLSDPFGGDYLKRVLIVSQASKYYKPAIYSAVTVTQYGSTEVSTGIGVETKLLNFIDSVELTEDSVCTSLSYKLVK